MSWRVGQRLQPNAHRARRLVRDDAGQIAGIDVLGIGPSRAASQYFSHTLAERAGSRPNNIDSFRFSAPIENEFWNFISKVDYTLTESAITSSSAASACRTTPSTIRRSFPGQDPRRQRLFNNSALRHWLRCGAQ